MAAGALSVLMTVLLMVGSLKRTATGERWPRGQVSGSGSHAGDARHTPQHAQLLDDPRQMHAIAHDDHHLHHAEAAIALVYADLVDADGGGGDAARQPDGQATPELQLEPLFQADLAA